jgi:hypothetical protein
VINTGNPRPIALHFVVVNHGKEIRGVVVAFSSLLIQVFLVKNFQVFAGFTTAHTCPRRQARSIGVIPSYLRWLSIRCPKSGGNDDQS